MDWNKNEGVQKVQAVQPLRSVQSPTLVLPRVAGEDTGGGIRLNGALAIERNEVIERLERVFSFL
jgi:hypothetical protein